VKVLVTGGLGFIGSHIVDQLVQAGHSVRVLDGLSPAAHVVSPDYHRDDVDYVMADLADPVAVERAVAGVDAVSHQAARVGLGVHFGDITDYVADNSLGTAVLLRALHARGFEGRLVLASSMVVYGEGGYTCPDHGWVRPPARRREDLDAGIFDPRCPDCGCPLVAVDLDEDSPLDPRNVYAATKVNQEHLSQAYAVATGAEVVRLRYHNVYGPRMPRDTPYAGVASIMRSAYAGGRSPSVFEDGQQRRDFVHVSDVARANVLSLTAPNGVAGAYNIASGAPHTIGDLATALRAAYGAEAAEPTVTGEYRLGDVRHITASPNRARARLSFAASVSFEEGMRAFATDPLRESAETVQRAR
jgi:dTDP-L-rhamnose 4-epimerase